jgi:mannose-6-phosphate isomerase class I
MRNIIFLEPVFKSMIWGGTKLRTDFGYDIPSDHTGECWAVSAHKNGDCRIKNGEYEGKSLSWLWDNHRELFGNASGEVFPLLIKIIDAKNDLSIQVHPDDEYAKEHENGSLGKTECWYILDCDENGQIVIGHNAADRQELKEMIAQKRWQELIRVQKIKRGDFFQINPGTVHAIKAGTMILETQQNSDITYRLYDYDRLENGKPRELHLEKSIDVITCPHRNAKVSHSTVNTPDYDLIELIRCSYYTVMKLTVHGEAEFVQKDKFLNVSIIGGSGTIDGHTVKKGDHFILPSDYGTYRLKGSMECILSSGE